MRILLAAFLCSVALAKGLPSHKARSNCNVAGVTHCCEEVTTTNDPRAIEILQAMGFPVPAKPVSVGENCTETGEQGNGQWWV
jgi:hypothetical protein